MAKARKAEAIALDTAPVSGADVEAIVVVDLKETKEQTMSATAAAGPTIEFAGSSVPADGFFTTPIDRAIELEYNGVPTVFLFKAGEPRQLPPGVVLAALGQGVQLAALSPSAQATG